MNSNHWRWLAGFAVSAALGIGLYALFAWATAGPAPLPATRVSACQLVDKMNLSWVSSELSSWVAGKTKLIPNAELSVFKSDAQALQGMNVADMHFYGDLQAAGILLSSAADSLWNTPGWSNSNPVGGVVMSWENGLSPALAQVATDCG